MVLSSHLIRFDLGLSSAQHSTWRSRPNAGGLCGLGSGLFSLFTVQKCRPTLDKCCICNGPDIPASHTLMECHVEIGSYPRTQELFLTEIAKGLCCSVSHGWKAGRCQTGTDFVPWGQETWVVNCRWCDQGASGLPITCF